MTVHLVYDGGDKVHIPPPMGTPREDQFVGTVAEQLCELAGRVCYDSLGKGRSSEEYFKHLLEVGHYSVFEHYNFTLEFQAKNEEQFNQYILCMLNRPGTWVTFTGKNILRLTFNLRTALEWDKWTEQLPSYDWNHSDMNEQLLAEITSRASYQSDNIINKWYEHYHPHTINTVYPMFPEEKWITLYLAGSRGFSHELVRHGNFTAISQRSTRYVDESKSAWHWHPLISQYIGETASPIYEILAETENKCADTYKEIVEQLQPWLEERIKEKNPDAKYIKTSARKQARGAARGFLGNALGTEVIFSASVSQWKHMLRMRAADAADAEIRVIFSDVLKVLKGSRYGSEFADMELAPASDGIGMSLKDGGYK